MNQSREYLEGIIDEQQEWGLTNGQKPRIYWQVARKDYMRFVRNRRPIRNTFGLSICWDAYNEVTTLQDMIERYKEQTGVYPQCVLVDKIYRTRDNLRHCAKHGIHMSGPKLGQTAREQGAERAAMS